MEEHSLKSFIDQRCGSCHPPQLKRFNRLNRYGCRTKRGTEQGCVSITKLSALSRKLVG